MKYTKFIIHEYKAISSPLSIDLRKDSLIPMIGINECGKTTVLNAILAFDYFNDIQNNSEHLKDIQNLYNYQTDAPRVAAEIEIIYDEFKYALKQVAEEKHDETIRNSYGKPKHKYPDNNTLTITRDLKTKTYEIEGAPFSGNPNNDAVARKIIAQLPYILYFDDFRDAIEEKVEIAKDSTNAMSGWLAIMEELFRKTNKDFSVFDLATMEDRKRKTVLSQVTKNLNQTLTEEWKNFRLDDSEALQIRIELEPETKQIPQTPPATPIQQTRYYLKLDLVDRDTEGNEHFFYIRNRSKGFYWFFNFVMKLEFNPKRRRNTEYGCIYLLDEPGSYLHAAAQTKLCRKLSELAKTNKVLYCTHSHYLLDPETIPINCIRVVQKNADGGIQLQTIHEFDGSMFDKKWAFQPVIDALKIKPFLLDVTHKKIVVVEGICDYYAIEMFKGDRELNALPSTGALQMKFYISILIAWQCNYRALWDNDEEGQKGFKEATGFFGNLESEARFLLLPKKDTQRKRIMQDLFAGGDLMTFKTELDLPANSSYEKTIMTLYFCSEKKRKKLIEKVTPDTTANFQKLFSALAIGEN